MSETWEPRFWAKVNKTEDCWLWTGVPDKHGYGRLRVGNKIHRAHRLAYQLAHGPITPGMEVDHVCPLGATRHCVRPDHLREATSKQNAENQAVARVHSASGLRGVTWAGKNGWRARVKHHGKFYSAGHFPTVEQAGAAVAALRNQLFTHNDQDRV